jgi:HEAT repeat protein
MRKIHHKTLFLLFALLLSLPCIAEVVMQFDLKVDTKSKQILLISTTQVSLTSVITLKLLNEDQQSEWWGIKADNLRLNGTHSDASYELPFAFRLNNKGVITNFWFPDDLSDAHIQKLKGLAYYFQWQDPEQDQNLTEQDNTGIYDAKYMTSKSGMIRKEKLSYQPAKDYQIKIIQSHHEILKATNFFEYSTGIEEFLFEHDITMMNLISKQKYEIKVRDSILPSTLLDLPSDLTLWSIDNKKEPIADNKIEFQRAMLIQILANQDLTHTPSSELALQLSNFTDGLDTIELMITNDQIKKSSYLRLFNALGQIDNKSSQLLLSNLIINIEIADNVKFLAMRALTKGQSALTLETTRNILSSLEGGINSDDIILKSSLIHGVGTILGHRLPNQFSLNIKDVLLAKMRSESSDTELSTFISSIGNTQDPVYIIELEEYKDSSSSQVRSSLAETLGRIESEESHAILNEMLKNEVNGSAIVQSSILKSLKNYPIGDKVITIALSYIDKSANEGVRFYAIDLMSNKKISEKHKSTLKSLMRKETNRKNFVAIANLLNQ